MQQETLLSSSKEIHSISELLLKIRNFRIEKLFTSGIISTAIAIEIAKGEVPKHEKLVIAPQNNSNLCKGMLINNGIIFEETSDVIRGLSKEYDCIKIIHSDGLILQYCLMTHAKDQSDSQHRRINLNLPFFLEIFVGDKYRLKSVNIMVSGDFAQSFRISLSWVIRNVISLRDFCIFLGRAKVKKSRSYRRFVHIKFLILQKL
jgi:hypothetical protein